MSNIRPSNMYRIASCPGYLNLAVPPIVDDSDSASRDEGILAHKVLECLAGGSSIPSEATSEMIADAGWALDIIDQTGDSYHEIRLFLDFISPEMEGTADAYTFENNTLNIYDYKYGRRPVSAEDNLQMICYALGILHSWKLGKPKVILNILQPNCSPDHNFYTYDRNDFYEYGLGIIKGIIEEAKTSVELVTGEHCRYCPKAYNCPALKADAVAPEIKLELMTPVEMCQALDEVKDIKELVNILQDSLEAAIISNINKGEPGLTYQLEPGLGRLNWDCPNIVDKLKKVEKALGVSLITEEACTPTQALGKKVPKEIIDKLAKRKPGKLSLKKIDFSNLFGEN